MVLMIYSVRQMMSIVMKGRIVMMRELIHVSQISSVDNYDIQQAFSVFLVISTDVLLIVVMDIVEIVLRVRFALMKQVYTFNPVLLLLFLLVLIS